MNVIYPGMKSIFETTGVHINLILNSMKTTGNPNVMVDLIPNWVDLLKNIGSYLFQVGSDVISQTWFRMEIGKPQFYEWSQGLSLLLSIMEKQIWKEEFSISMYMLSS